MSSVLGANPNNLIPLSEVSRLVPSSPSPATVNRWASKGVRGKRLETHLIGGRRFVDRESLERFFS